MNKEKNEDQLFRVEVDQNGCPHCGTGRTWTIVTPDNVALGQSWDDEIEALEWADELNAAYNTGFADGKAGKEPIRAAKYTVRIELMEEGGSQSLHLIHGEIGLRIAGPKGLGKGNVVKVFLCQFSQRELEAFSSAEFPGNEAGRD